MEKWDGYIAEIKMGKPRYAVFALEDNNIIALDTVIVKNSGKTSGTA